MKKHSKLTILVGCTLAAFLITACAKKDSSSSSSTATTTTAYVRTNTPKTLTVSTPTTLKKSSSSRTASREAAAVEANREAVGFYKMLAAEAEMNLMFIDAAIEGNKLVKGDNSSTGCQAPAAVSFTWTAEMSRAMEEDIFTKMGMSASEIATEVAEMKGQEGTIQSGPAIHYYDTTGVFAYVLEVGACDDAGNCAACASSGGSLDNVSEIVKWTSDKNKVYYSQRFTEDGFTIQGVMAYDNDSQRGTFTGIEKSSSVEYRIGGEMKVCDTGTNCIDYELTFIDAEGANKCSDEIHGRANDSGGVATMKLSCDNETFWDQEYFNSSGTLVGFYASDNGTANCWDDDPVGGSSNICTWETETALTDTSLSAYQTGKDNVSTRTYTYTYSSGFPDNVSDNGTYAFVNADQTVTESDHVIEDLDGMLIVLGGSSTALAVKAEGWLVEPGSSGDNYSIYKNNGYSTVMKSDNYSTTASASVIVTF